MTISGKTRLYGIIADPISHVRAPTLFNPKLAAAGIDAVVVPLHVAPADLPALFAGLRALRNFDGLFVTVPHKTAAAALCDALDDEARMTRAVNAIRRGADGAMRGAMFDGAGFVAGLRADGIEPSGLPAHLVGAGGAAVAIAFALTRAGVARLGLSNRSRAKAEELAARLWASFPGIPVEVTDDPGDARLIVNATSLGLRADDPMPLDPARLVPSAVVADIIMDPAETRLLRAAAARGLKIHHGRHMLDHQARLLAEFLGMAI